MIDHLDDVATQPLDYFTDNSANTTNGSWVDHYFTYNLVSLKYALAQIRQDVGLFSTLQLAFFALHYYSMKRFFYLFPLFISLYSH